MDIIIAIIVVVWIIYADKKRKAKKAQENAGMNRQSVGKVNRQSAAGITQSNVQNRRMQQPEEENSILSRAAANVQEEAVDELRFEQMEETVVDSLDLALIESSPLMQQISDLMITGYTGELSFGRDFVAEGVEMLNRCEMMEF